jgi:cytochrome c oxidase subunit III
MPPPLVTTPRHASSSGLAVRFILVSASVYAAAGVIAWLLIRVVPIPRVAAEAMFPPAFVPTTLLLIAGSVAMQRAVAAVRRERQRVFRRLLLAALLLGTLFVGIQSYGVRCLVRHQMPEEVQTGANAFLTMLATLHAMHFTLALMALVWVTLNARADRYDHEYYWGVTLCAWFWHGLGIAWCAILVVFAIAV